MLSLRNTKKQITAFDKALEIEPEKINALAHKGHALVGLKKYEEAITAFDKALETEPEDVNAWVLKGNALVGLKKYEEAITAFNKALEIDPEYLEPHFYLGNLFFSLGNIKDSTKKVEELLDKNKNHALGLNLNGRIKIEEKCYYKAIEFFERAISLDMGNPMHLLWAAYANYLNLEFSSCPKKNECQEKEALTLIIRKLEKAKNLINEKTDDEIQAYILYFLGYSYSKIHDSFEAKETLEKCVKIKSTIKNPSRKLLDNIWNYQTKPNWIEWWLASPVDCWIKRFVFSVLSLSVFVLFLTPIIYPNNEKNFTPYYFFIIFLLMIIISPRIESFKAKEFEIEIQSPPPNEFFLSIPIMEFRIEELERILISRK